MKLLRDRTIAFLIGAVSAFGPLAGCSESQQPLRRETTAMETFLSVTLYDDGLSPEEGHRLIDSVFLEVARIENMATDYSDSSEIGRINTGAGHGSTTVSAEIIALIGQALRYTGETDGAFDVTVGPLVRLWDFNAEAPVVPDEDAIEERLDLVGPDLVVLTEGGVALQKPGMRLDLGGIAKGYAVDRGLAILRRNGVRGAIVDLGGNLGVWWEGSAGLDSTIASISIRHPRKDGEMYGRFPVGTCGIATSGDYQRFFVHEGIRYHHLLDPKSGRPARDLVSVTIVAKTGIDADALSTAVFVLGREEGMKLIESADGVDGVLIVASGDTLIPLVSSGLKAMLEELP